MRMLPLLRLVAVPTVWYAHLTIVYGAEAIVCTPPVSSDYAMLWTGSIATAAALAILAGLVTTRSRMLFADKSTARHTSAFLYDATLLLGLLATLGIIWTALPIALLSSCLASTW